METSGSHFLHERNPAMHTSPEVETVVAYLRANGETIANKPTEKINAYLGVLASTEYVNDGIVTGDQDSIDRQVEARVIKAADVPNSYFDLQRRIAREQGHGDIPLNNLIKRQMVETAQEDQRAGLQTWAGYLSGPDCVWPDWFKHYTWNSITKLSTYNKEKTEFPKRSRGTAAPYPELNREALASVYDAADTSMEAGQSAKLRSFGKLYGEALQAATLPAAEAKKDLKGSWVTYKQTNEPASAKKLSDSLKGKATGWCTASEKTAAIQLAGGDFYVHYTPDTDNTDTVPRIAIRMQGGEVAEARGISSGQEIESGMLDAAEQKLHELPGGEAYVAKAANMKLLTALDSKTKDNPDSDLSPSEIRFLYELDGEITGFGSERDPRIDEITSRRNVKTDIDRIYGGQNAALEAIADRSEQGIQLRTDTNYIANADLTESFADSLARLTQNSWNVSLDMVKNLQKATAIDKLAFLERFGSVGQSAKEQAAKYAQYHAQELLGHDDVMLVEIGGPSLEFAKITDEEGGFLLSNEAQYKLAEREIAEQSDWDLLLLGSEGYLNGIRWSLTEVQKASLTALNEKIQNASGTK